MAEHLRYDPTSIELRCLFQALDFYLKQGYEIFGELKEERERMRGLLAKIEAKKESHDWGTVKSKDILEAQKAWEHYRDAWVEFAQVKYPKYTPGSVNAWFTKKRNHMLDSFGK